VGPGFPGLERRKRHSWLAGTSWWLCTRTTDRQRRHRRQCRPAGQGRSAGYGRNVRSRPRRAALGYRSDGYRRRITRRADVAASAGRAGSSGSRESLRGCATPRNSLSTAPREQTPQTDIGASERCRTRTRERLGAPSVAEDRAPRRRGCSVRAAWVLGPRCRGCSVRADVGARAAPRSYPQLCAGAFLGCLGARIVAWPVAPLLDRLGAQARPPAWAPSRPEFGGRLWP
jgi:hypothetical protein